MTINTQKEVKMGIIRSHGEIYLVI